MSETDYIKRLRESLHSELAVFINDRTREYNQEENIGNVNVKKSQHIKKWLSVDDKNQLYLRLYHSMKEH